MGIVPSQQRPPATRARLPRRLRLKNTRNCPSSSAAASRDSTLRRLMIICGISGVKTPLHFRLRPGAVHGGVGTFEQYRSFLPSFGGQRNSGLVSNADLLLVQANRLANGGQDLFAIGAASASDRPGRSARSRTRPPAAPRCRPRETMASRRLGHHLSNASPRLCPRPSLTDRNRSRSSKSTPSWRIMRRSWISA